MCHTMKRLPRTIKLLEGVEVPEARLSVNDKTTDSDEVYFNTKHDCTVYTQVEIS